MFSFRNVSYVSLLCAEHTCTHHILDSNDAEFLAFIKSKYVTFVSFYHVKSSSYNSMAAILVDCLQQSS